MELISNFALALTQDMVLAYLSGMHRTIILQILLLTILDTCLFAQQRNINYYLEAVKSNHPALKDLENQARMSELDNSKIRSEYRLPSVYATVNLMKAPLVSGVGYDESITNGALYSTLINAEQSIFNPSYKPEVEGNKLQADRYRFQGHALLRDLEKQVTDQYIICYANQQYSQSLIQQKDLLQVQSNTCNRLAKNGLFKVSDLILLDIEIINMTIQNAELQSQVSKDLSILNSLCGLTDTSIVHLDSVNLIINQVDTSHENFNHQFVLDSMIALNNLRISAQKYKPQLSIFANMGFNATDPGNIQNNLGFSAGLDFKMNFYDGRQQKINREQTKIQLESIESNQHYFDIQRMHSKQNILNRIESLSTEKKLAERQLDKYQTLLSIYLQGITNGDYSVLDYLTLLRTFRKLMDEQINYEEQIQSSINSFNYWNW